MMRSAVLGLAALLCAGLALVRTDAAVAAETGAKARVGSLAISGAWIRGVQPAAGVAAGYLEITNEGETSDRLVAVSAPFARRSGFHRMSVEGGAMRIGRIDGGLPIGPGERVTFEPGANHVLFKGLLAAPTPGETLPVRLRFEVAGDVELDLPVSAIGAAALDECRRVTR